MRVYSESENQLRYESKFLRNEVYISADELRQRWASLSAEEQFEFAMGFEAKPTWSTEDERILEFVMEVGNEYVIQTLAYLIGLHCEKKKAVAYLLARLDRVGGFPRTNYYDVLGRINDRDAIPPLRKMYEAYSRELIGKGEKALLTNTQAYVDYLYCCAALRALDGAPEFEASIRTMQNDEDEDVRICARRLLGIVSG
jgi:hypothetical protein